jgi:hypothetical protein
MAEGKQACSNDINIRVLSQQNGLLFVFHSKAKVKQSLYRSGHALRLPGG